MGDSRVTLSLGLGNAFPAHPSVRFRKFRDFDSLVHFDVSKDLGRRAMQGVRLAEHAFDHVLERAVARSGELHELPPRHVMQLSFSPRRSAVTPWR